MPASFSSLLIRRSPLLLFSTAAATRPVPVSSPPLKKSILSYRSQPLVTGSSSAPFHHHHHYSYPLPTVCQPKQAAPSFWVVALSLVAFCGGSWFQFRHSDPPEASTTTTTTAATTTPASPEHLQHDSLIEVIKMSASAQPTGFPNNLTAEQEAKLRELWIMTLKVFGVDLSEIEKVAPRPATPQTPPPQERRPRRSMLNGIFGYRDEPPSESAPATTEAAESQNALNATVSAMSISDGDDKYGMSKQFQKIVNETPAEELRSSFWSMVKHNDPDSLLLRFLRARKWDVKQALIMFITTIHWRAREAHVDDDVMKNGDVLAFKQLQSSDPKEKKAGEEFLQQLRLGKNYFRGFDKSGRPICVIRVRKHRAGDQSVQVMERYTIYTIELARLMLADQVETATIVFDMSDFSMANMDYTPVKLMIKCFEANYPECLGAVLIHKAPWLFSGIWSIIKGWLDPVVASKVHFTNNDKDLENFIPRDRIVKELDGDDQWEFEYSEPNEGENEKMQDTATRDAIVARRDELSRRLEASTIKWIVSALKKDNDTKATAEQERREVTKQMNDQYWELDPYIRARSAYDRAGVIAGNGNINFYPDRRPSQVEPAKSNGGSAEKKKSISSTEIQPGVKDETAP